MLCVTDVIPVDECLVSLHVSYENDWFYLLYMVIRVTKSDFIILVFINT